MTGKFRPAAILILIIAAYAVLLVAAVLILPLRVPEILQLIVTHQRSLDSLLAWIAQVPSSGPLNYFVQLPFVMFANNARWGARLPSVLFALASCYLFFRLAKRVPLQNPYLALLVFMLLPVHYRFATEARPFEQALFFLLLATNCFFRLLKTPRIATAFLYSGLLLLCLYTDRGAYLPAIGYMLFLVAFVNRAHERRALWFALPTTIVPVLLFVPYYLWARPQVNPNWLFEPPVYRMGSSIYVQAFHSLGGEGSVAYVLAALLVAGAFAGLWVSFRPAVEGLSKRIVLFCLFGGIVSTFTIELALDAWNGYIFSRNQALRAVPAVIVLVFAALEWLGRASRMPAITRILAMLLIAISIASNVPYLLSGNDDLQHEAMLVAPELTARSCVVFVSERLSEPMFLLFEPNLKEWECMNFFHGRVVLASHPYVRPDQQEDAESYFRGLNYVEVKRIRVGGGQIVVMQESK
jgi:4-amino-4-deoxy-L-arabinose transferase-like glycosyltransferase